LSEATAANQSLITVEVLRFLEVVGYVLERRNADEETEKAHSLQHPPPRLGALDLEPRDARSWWQLSRRRETRTQWRRGTPKRR
jgi:hypothetical protein